MKILLLSLVILVSSGCGKILPQTKTKDPVETQTPPALTEWSGKSDFIEARWSIKTQP